MNGDRRHRRKSEVTIEVPTVVPMPESGRSAAIAVLARWLAELLADESFQRRHEQRLNRCRDRRRDDRPDNRAD